MTVTLWAVPACGMVISVGETERVASPAACTIAIWAVSPALSVTMSDLVISSIVALAGKVMDMLKLNWAVAPGSPVIAEPLVAVDPLAV